VRNATGESVGEVFLAIREGRGINSVEEGERVPWDDGDHHPAGVTSALTVVSEFHES
jgi:hypothetical protein